MIAWHESPSKTALTRLPTARADLGMATPDLRKDGNGAQAWGRLQDRHDLGVPYVGERIRPAPAARGLLLRGQARISFDPVASRWRETRLGGGDSDSGGAAAREKAERLAKKRPAIVAALRADPNASQVARQTCGVSYIKIREIAKAEGIRLEGKSWRRSAPHYTERRP
jgi:hypothetical protein